VPNRPQKNAIHQRDFTLPSQLINRVDNVRHHDTVKIWDSFIHMMVVMDVPGAIRMFVLARAHAAFQLKGQAP
jgi:hypothetical protein